VVGRSDRRGNPLTTVVCRRCGLVSHGEIPTDEALQEYYSRQYRRDYHNEITPSARRVIRAWNRGRQIYRRLQDFVRPGDAVFEVGAGLGCNLKPFELAGCDAWGIEPGESFCAFSADQLKVRIENCDLSGGPQTAGHDLVLLSHVIEHLSSPRQALMQIRRLLRPGGRLYIECPNLAGPHAAPGKMFHFAHIYNFTPQTLTMLAEATGYRVMRRFSDQRDQNIELLLVRSEVGGLDVDPASYAATCEALTRYNALTYHLRSQYARRRVQTLFQQHSARILSKRRLQRIVVGCREHARRRDAAQPEPVPARRAA